MKTQIESSIKLLAEKASGDIKADDAMKLAQAALNLSHTLSILAAVEGWREAVKSNNADKSATDFIKSAEDALSALIRLEAGIGRVSDRKLLRGFVEGLLK